MANRKPQGYTVVSWPESMPENWVEQLNSLPFGYCVALHDKDVDEDGVIKKAHMHFFFQGNPTPKQREYIHASLGVYYGEPVRNAEDMYNYLTHEDKPDKYHYSRDIINASPKWCQELFEQHITPKYDTTSELLDIIETQHIEEYADLVRYVARYEDRPDLMKEVQKYWVTRYVDSIRHGKDKRHE